uniref:Uncharacterized protein n=1 Tax=Manihot esculenta TaxID=3983 RepID=A0A2C9UYL9_MANES
MAMLMRYQICNLKYRSCIGSSTANSVCLYGMPYPYTNLDSYYVYQGQALLSQCINVKCMPFEAICIHFPSYIYHMPRFTIWKCRKLHSAIYCINFSSSLAL